MKPKKSMLALGALLAGSVYAISAIALPAGGENEILYWQYYTNAAMTQEAGVRVISNGSACDVQRIDYGSTTSYRRLVREACQSIENPDW
ncbi:hypothetical protein [Lysobacter brunescens]|uniref:Secreted protein n=1 Tax=Lysobacter brunescens TaxID=262323 RepID=A0ABW2YG23_9GAMM